MGTSLTAMLAIIGKLTNPKFANGIFQTADQLFSELILLFIAIQAGVFTHPTTDYLFAVLIIVLGLYLLPTSIGISGNLASQHRKKDSRYVSSNIDNHKSYIYYHIDINT